MTEKERLVEHFINNIMGKVPDVSKSNKKHDCKKGHWLET